MFTVTVPEGLAGRLNGNALTGVVAPAVPVPTNFITPKRSERATSMSCGIVSERIS